MGRKHSPNVLQVSSAVNLFDYHSEGDIQDPVFNHKTVLYFCNFEGSKSLSQGNMTLEEVLQFRSLIF